MRIQDPATRFFGEPRPPFSHCVFTASDKFDKDRATRFTQLMRAMNPDDASTREVMYLEGAKKWVSGSPEGFKDLIEALGGN
jgi:ABC-type phosphate/phosphonate transport system substrate-binding protein